MSRLRIAVGTEPTLLFERPREVLRARDLAEAVHALQYAEGQLASGAWLAGYLAYDLGAAFVGLPMRPVDDPLLVLGLFEAPAEVTLLAIDTPSHPAPLPLVSRREYDAAIASLRRSIADGDVYQVNYTVPFALAAAGDPFALYAAIAQRTGARYQAYVEDDDRAILSWSPELFLEFDGNRLVTRPMKGTAPLDEPEQLQNEKNRAEHLMIVDLLRNDFHRICDDVRVEELFAIERYPAFVTMTSTIAGRLRPGSSLAEIFRATFPCGSVTGAPKRSAISFIASHERRSRGVYCGTVGYLSPQRRGWWNVAIRTAQLDARTGAGRFDVGGGIVADSDAQAERDEIEWKMQFLRPPDDAFALLETFASHADNATLALHAARLERTAAAFGVPLGQRSARIILRQAQDDAGGLVRVRVALDGTMTVRGEELERPAEPVRVCIAGTRVRSDDPFLQHKTSWRPVQDEAAAQARTRGCFEALLQNERDELTEGSRSSLFAEFDGALWTPPLMCGLLPGVLRGQLLAQGRVCERVLTLNELRRADAIYVGNSARGMLRAVLVEESER